MQELIVGSCLLNLTFQAGGRPSKALIRLDTAELLGCCGHLDARRLVGEKLQSERHHLFEHLLLLFRLNELAQEVLVDLPLSLLLLVHVFQFVFKLRKPVVDVLQGLSELNGLLVHHFDLISGRGHLLAVCGA